MLPPCDQLTPSILVARSRLNPGTAFWVIISQFEGFVCNMYFFFSVFLTENQGFEGIHREDLGVSRAVAQIEGLPDDWRAKHMGSVREGEPPACPAPYFAYKALHIKERSGICI